MRGIILIVVVLQVYGSLGNSANDSFNSEALRSISGSFNEFAKDLYQTIAKYEDGNFVFSPISVSTVLSMMAMGSYGNTRNELVKLLHFGDNWILQQTAIKPFLEKLNSFSKVDLKLANKIFLSDDYNLNDDFAYYANLYFKTLPQIIDFSDSQGASKSINEWCEKETNSKIANMVSPGDLSPDTVLMLLNAVYFKGNWSEKFDKSETRNLPFNLANGAIKEVPTMFHRGNYSLGSLRDLKAKFLRIPYENAEENDGLSMYIILPDGSSGLSDLEKDLSKLDLNILSNVEFGEIELYLPKFRVDAKLELNTPLKELGLTEIFSTNADFRHLLDSHDVAVSKITQKAFIEVNEEGSEAAAITEDDFIDRMGPVSFWADRPFISLVATKNSILFMSRIVEP